MPRPAEPGQPSMISGVPGYQALSPRLGNKGNRPLATEPFANSFVIYTNNPMMQTQGGKIIQEPPGRLFLKDIRE